MDEELDFPTLCMQLVALAGEAKSEYVDAIKLAKTEGTEAAKARWEEANGIFKEAHDAHFQLMGSGLGPADPMEQILLIHAEDQLADAETYKLLAQELTELYQRLG